MDYSYNRSTCTNEVSVDAFLRHPAMLNSGSSILVGSLFLQNSCGFKSFYKNSVMALKASLQGSSHSCGFGSSPNHHISRPGLNRRTSCGGDVGFVCRGSREGSTQHSSPEEEDSDKDHDSAVPIADGKVLPGDQNGEAANEADWRVFRASLVASEQSLGNRSKVGDPSEASVVGITGTLGKTWAHPLHVPEAGCVLVATDKLDGQIDFERTVILLLRVGSNKPREGPFGVILNRPTLQTIKELEPESRTLANVFGNCQYFYGGPLESELFLLMQEGGSHKQFGEVIPGISHVGLDGLQHAAHLIKDGAISKDDFRFYVGYAGWGLDQLMNEIASGYWYVAACSTTLLKVSSTDRLWQKVLRLMGGQYAELSRKPRKGGF